MLGRLTNLPAIAASAIALGLLEVNVGWNDELTVGPFHLDLGSDFVMAPVLAVVIIVALLVMRPGSTRAERDDTSSWRVADEIRPDPARAAAAHRSAGGARPSASPLVAALLVALPYLPWIGRPGNTLKAAAVLLFAIVSLSIMILTGWAGQVSLGQMGFVAIGGALGAKATTDWGLDLALVDPAGRLRRRARRRRRRPARAAAARPLPRGDDARVRARDRHLLPQPAVLRLGADPTVRTRDRCSASGTSARRPKACTSSA